MDLPILAYSKWLKNSAPEYRQLLVDARNRFINIGISQSYYKFNNNPGTMLSLIPVVVNYFWDVFETHFASNFIRNSRVELHHFKNLEEILNIVLENCIN